MNNWLFRLGALNAASSVAIQAVGGHKPWDIDRKLIFNKAFDLQLSSSIGMMICAFKAKNWITTIPGILFFLGSILFSGFAYYRCFNNDRKYNFLMPAGGSCIIFGWILLAFS